MMSPCTSSSFNEAMDATAAGPRHARRASSPGNMPIQLTERDAAAGVLGTMLITKSPPIKGIFDDIPVPKYSKIDDRAFWACFSHKRWLGSGSFSSVYDMEHKGTHERFAVKVCKLSPEDPQHLRMTREEFHVLANLRHENILRLYAAYESPSHIYFVSELLTGGELVEWIGSSKSLKYCEDDVRGHIKTLVGAISYLHNQCRVAHRDLKPENILMSSFTRKGKLKIIDFGLARSFARSERMYTVCGTHIYLAPEVVACGQRMQDGYTAAVDMWGIGLITYIMLFGWNPFVRKSVNATQKAILKCHVPFPKVHNISADGVAFIKSLLCRTPAERPLASASLELPWLHHDPSALAKKCETQVELFSRQNTLDASVKAELSRDSLQALPGPISPMSPHDNDGFVQTRLWRWNAHWKLYKACNIKPFVKFVTHRIKPPRNSVSLSPRAGTLYAELSIE